MIRDPEDALLAELTAAIDDAELLSEAEYEDPDQFGDALLNNLPAIAYALGAGLPVTAWKSAAKNPGEEERVLRAVRTWGDQARLLLNELVTGNMTLEEFRDAMVEGYRRQARNSYIAGRRAMGDLEPLSPNEEAKLAAELDDDEEELGGRPTETVTSCAQARRGDAHALQGRPAVGYWGPTRPSQPTDDYPLCSRRPGAPAASRWRHG